MDWEQFNRRRSPVKLVSFFTLLPSRKQILAAICQIFTASPTLDYLIQLI